MSLNKDLAEEFLEEHPDLDSGHLEEVLMEFLRRVKNSSSGTITLYLSKAIDAREVLDLVRRAIKPGAAGRDRIEPSPRKTSSGDTLEEFAKKALHAARTCKQKWHSNAFICSAWEQMHSSMTLDEFKERLAKAHMEDLISLSRADLVDAMPEAYVRKSELKRGSARFHFINLDWDM